MAVSYMSSRGCSSHTDDSCGALRVYGGGLDRLVSLLSINFYPECHLLSLSPSLPQAEISEAVNHATVRKRKNLMTALCLMSPELLVGAE